MIRTDRDIHPLMLPCQHEVHLHLATLKLPADAVDAASRALAPEELVRAERFQRMQDRTRFIAARTWLRQVLGSYLGTEARELAFAYGLHGKPRLANGGGGGAIHFNLSHAEGRALLAVSSGFEVGVDIESIRPFEERVAEHFFSPGEVAKLARLPANVRTDAFYRCWTRKEAYLKALGSGLAVPLDAFTVSLRPGEPARLIEVRGSPDEADWWQIVDLDLGPGLAGAVAARQRGWLVHWPLGAPHR